MNTTLFAFLGFIAIMVVGVASIAIAARNGPGQEAKFIVGCALILGVSVLAVRMVNPDVSTTHLFWAGAGTAISGLAWGAVAKFVRRRKSRR